MNAEYNVASILGYRENVDEDLSALVSTNPTQVLYGHLLADSLVAGSPNVGIWAEFEIFADLYDLKNPGLSLTAPSNIQ
jgi:hypothetical protein